VKIFPAIDLKENKCVRLSKGDDNTSVVFNQNPVEQAMYFEDQGCKRLHLVDLDSAFGRNNINNKTIQNIRNAISIPIQIGGGIRSENIAKSYFDLGADFLIIGSYAVSNTQEVKNLAENFKQKIYIALDVLNNKIMIKGWVEESDFTPEKIFQTYDQSSIRGYVLTDIEKDGMLTGLNQKMISTNVFLTHKKLIVGGGLKNNLDLERLRNIKSANLEGVIAGKSFYVGNIDLKEAQKVLDGNV
jgi:phosphoribosylformimino-5-aminoimidazole carboxamide ribotide isomerase